MNLFKEYLNVFICCLCFPILYAQNPYQDKSITNSYETYSELPRELAYTHLNKSIYIKGEHIGFSAYAFDKGSKQLSTVTRNLYCTLSDSSNTIIKSKLIKVEQGVANNIFEIDSLFTSGNYVFKAYTNHMLNFEERNYFSQQISIIDPDKETVIKPKKGNLNIDAQFLPEGGHFLANVSNVVGVVVKDSLGFGVPFVDGVLKDDENNTISTFKVNELGIGRFPFIPDSKKNYHVELNYKDKNFKFFIDNIESQGIALELKPLNNKIGLVFKTNTKTLPLISNNDYKLIIHNGQYLKEIPIRFSDKTEILNLIKQDDLFSGINIFTLFDANNNPILERLFFNYQGINILQSDNHIITKAKDSTAITLSYKDINPETFNNLSVSVLPASTKSYGAHHNIISYTYLQPYVNGYIENARYYFTNISNKTKYDLDNLLITQGWSAYNWDNIFNNPPIQTYNFDVGISFKAKVKKQKELRFLVHPLDTLNQPEFYPVSKTHKGFLVTNKFPKDNDSLSISEVQKNGKLMWTNLTLDFYPKTIPDLKINKPQLGNKESIIKSTQTQPFSETSLDETQQLDEVVVHGKYKLTKIDKIKIRQGGRIDVFDDKMRNFYITFEDYIVQKGYAFMHYEEELYLFNTSREIFPSEASTVYIDGLEQHNLDFLRLLPMDNIEYININRHKQAYTNRRGGVIHIVTNPQIPISPKIVKPDTKYKIPLTFASNKKFYIPKYNSYTSRFFNEYGVIDWFPKNKVNEKGDITLKFQDNGVTDVKLYIEGTVNDGGFISEIKMIDLN